MDKIEVSIIDYGMGNLFSVQQACEYAGLTALITSDKEMIMKSDAVVLPGVGAFGDAIDNLKERDLISPIKEFIASKRLFVGICLGMQLLMSESDEFGKHKGLGIIDGSVVKFPARNSTDQRIKVPQVGWNSICLPRSSSEGHWHKTPLSGFKNGEFMYFVHSYYTVPVNPETILCVTDYEGTEYPSGILWRNVFACQFHPEKSGPEGIRIYRNLASMIQNQEVRV
jgi:glutamine amidotransferase